MHPRAQSEYRHVTAEHHIDARGLLCPLPVLKFKKYIKNLASGSVIHVSTTDPDSVKDFNVFAQMKGYTIRESHVSDNGFGFVIQI